MSIFQRVFRLGKAEVHSAIDKIEDPIRMTEQGIRDLPVVARAIGETGLPRRALRASRMPP